MTSRTSYRLRIYGHVVGIFTAVIAAVLFGYASYWVTASIFASIACMLPVSLLRVLAKHQQQVSRLIAAMNSDDFSLYFASGKNAVHADDPLLALHRELQQCVDHFRGIRAQQQQQLQSLTAVIEQVPVAILDLDDQERVLLRNKAARTLFRGHRVGTLADLPAGLAEILRTIEPGQRHLVHLEQLQIPTSVVVEVATIRQGQRIHKIVSAENIQRELDSTESRAWSRVSQVLAHEIINSLTPVTSLAQTLLVELDAHEELLQARAAPELLQSADESLQDIRDGLTTMARRGQGLMRFVDDYRKVAQVPTPRPQWIALQPLFVELELLIRAELAQREITMHIEVSPPHLKLWADRELIEQCLINLLKNAAEACQDAKTRQISLSAGLDEVGQTLITVSDSGSGISEEQAPNLFVPFYSTKSTGSGIGLGIVRQIAHAHRAHVRAFNQANSGACFELRFAATASTINSMADARDSTL